MMARHLAAAIAGSLALAAAPALPAHAAELDPGRPIAACLEAAAGAYHLPPGILLVLLDVEGGSIGQVVGNADGSTDIGPMQVNDAWLPKLAQHWQTAPAAAFQALRDQFCANVEGGAWILRQAIDEARGDLWDGVGRYHSRDPLMKTAYLRRVADAISRRAAAAQGSADTQLRGDR